MENWIVTDWQTAVMSLLSLAVVYFTIIVLTRIVGLRSFSKMSASDFAMTVAIGTLLAGAATSPNPSIMHAMVAFSGLFFLQWLVAFGRRRSKLINQLIDNTPLLLMDGPDIIDANLQSANVSKDDLLAKLREANVLEFSQVRAVVFETTGDISVLHTSGDTKLADALLEGVRRS